MKTRTAKRGGSPRGVATPRRKEHQGWPVRRAGGLRILESRALGKLGWLVHGFSTRPGGESVLDGKPTLNLGFTDWDERARVEKNRAAFAAALGARKMPLVALRQFHSDVIYVPSAPAASPEDAPRADALATRAWGFLLGIQTADCVPILLADTRQRAVAAIHAGWRGTLARIAVKALGRMRMEFGTKPADVVAAIGPSIGRCCYEVGAEVAQAFAMQFPPAADWFDGPFEQLSHGEEPLWLPWLTMMPPGHVPPPPRVQLDLRAANRWQLMDAGVPESQIDVSDLCTACRTDLLFSYRREGAKTGRMMAVIGVRAAKK
ncbi:MAG: peptidoglycan editing factor PgeF [Acidobacteriia bacterium]|nr:peptidoglycan editing factor PgeF [Terriglobia bacterium]